jgi:hypothetical protein
MTTQLRFAKAPAGPPVSLQDHFDAAIRKVQGISARQRLALTNELLRTSRDLGFIRLVHDQASGLGPHSDAAAGIPKDTGTPL